ncbi:calcium-binding protein [Microvirga solisilvae]|uniref:calcium-binding protein n=1 Tax=Microvirga solisilvae TaxID=2919498 RepID=UPI001FB03763|nr:calcium-binding protein [Microvirga solisilvae]
MTTKKYTLAQNTLAPSTLAAIIPVMTIHDATAGADNFVGTAADFDLVSYKDATGPVIVVLPGPGATNSDGAVSTGWAAGDTYGDSIDGIEGTSGADKFYGNGADNFFIGGAGADTFYGGAGIDTISYQTATSAIRINIGYFETGIGDALGDTVQGIENIVGSSFNDTITGSGEDNKIEGGDGNDLLQGSTGADTIDGGDGIDTVSYSYSDSWNVVIDLGAVDGIQAGLETTNHARGDKLISIENVIGTKWADKITGNDVANVLDGGKQVNGGTAVDTLAGAGGNDIYYVDENINNYVDIVIEKENEGTDLVYTTYNYTLTAHVENLTAIAGKWNAVRLTGNNLANTIIGNEANNVINGLTGADYMAGGRGNDVYYIHDASDRVVETSTGGVDTVYSYVSCNLANYVENLYGAGSSAINLTGNTLANVIKGNSGNNKINGYTGKDVLYGGSGKDIFQFTTAATSSNVDKIADYNVAYDSIQLDNRYFTKLGSGTPTSPKKLASSAFWKGAKAHDSNDRIIYDATKGYLYYDADGTGSSKQVLIATMAKGLKMNYAEFFVI